MMSAMLPGLGASKSSSRLVAAAIATLGLASCASPPPPVVLAPPINAEQIALRLETRGLEGPARILFSWSISERDARFSGRGVARIEPPFKARLDLFFGTGETIARAALVDDDLRLPPGTPAGIIPPAELLWGALGIFRPGPETALLGADDLGDRRVRLRYLRPDGIEVRYTVKENRVEVVERVKQGQTVEMVTVEAAAASPYPTQATYRNIPAFRELRLTRDSVESVEAYPPDLWELAP